MIATSSRCRHLLSSSLICLATVVGVVELSGCERKEKVVDIETPGRSVEVERNIDTGEVEVESERN